MSVVELLDTLAGQGVELWFEGERLRFRAPKGALTPEQRAQLSSRRSEVVAQLRKNAAVTRDFPLSFSQRSLWFVHQENPVSAAYNVAFQARVVSTVDVPALRQALQAILDRHATLRTTYLARGGVLVQSVAGTAEVAFATHDASGIDDATFDECVRADYRRPFDLEAGPVFRAKLFSRGPANHVLLLTAHHIAADGWSLLQLLEELRALYAEATGGATAALPRADAQYTDVATWQSEVLAGPDGVRLENYWTDKLARSPSNVEIPSDRPRPTRRRDNGATVEFKLDTRLSVGIRELARKEGVTPFVILLAAFKALLFRYTGTDDIIVGTPTFGRNRAEFSRIVGDFVNTLPLRTFVDGGLSFRDFAGRVRQTLLDALAAQDFPFPLIVEKVQPVRDPGRSPLFDILFVLQRFDMVKELESVMIPRDGAEPVDFGGLRLTYFALPQQLGQFDLTLEMVDGVGAFGGHFKYDADLFDRDTIARLSDHFRTLLEGVVADPSKSLQALSLLTDAEMEAIAAALPESARPTSAITLPALVEEQARRTPEARAVTFGATSLTYDALNRRANRLAHRLRGLGVAPGTLVGVGVERSLDLLVSLLGILKAGGAYVPIDLAYPADRVAFVLGDAGASVLVTQRALAERFAGQAATAVFVDDDLAAYPDTNPEPRATPDALAYVIYTSGSTGQPKGVEVAHRNVVSFLAAMRATPGCTAADVLLAVTTVAFDIAGLELWLPLSVGAHVVLAARSDAVDGERLGALIAQHGVTLLQATPATWRLLLDAGWAGTPTLTALCGGEALPRDLAAALVPRVRALWNMYGPTETTIWSTLSPITDAAAPITIGRPIAGTRVYVVEPSGQLAPAGVPGELCIAGAGVARGYHHRPELTAEKFTALPLPDGRTERVYHTGDIVRARPDGALEYRGRRDQQIKLRGYRIELGEIEAVLARAAGGRPCAVALREDRPDPRLVAYVVPDASTKVSVVDLRRALRAELPEYMIPAAFVFLDALPLTPNGKVDRKALPEPEADRQTEERFVAPRDGTEKRVAEIWEQALRVPRVGAHDSFFELGGNSLRAIDVVFRIRKVLGVKLSLVQFLQQPTIAAVAELLDANGATQSDRPNGVILHGAGRELHDLLKARPDERFDPFPLTDVQEAYWIGRGGGFEMGNVATHVYAEVEIEGLDLGKYERAWQRLIDRHDMLRAIVRPDGMQQVLEQTPTFVIRTQDLAGRSAETADAALAATRHELSHQILPSDQWPLFEIRASRLTPSRYRIHLSLDLLISDAWSFGVLQRDFDRLYADPDCQLEPLGISFRDYVLAMVRFRETEDYKRSLAYWDAKSASLPTRPDLPMAKDPASITQPRFVRRHGSLDRKEWAALKKKADAIGLTHNGLILAAYADVLATWSRRSRFLLNLTLFNRVPVHPQVEEIVGDFTSITLLDAELLPDESFVDLARKLVGRLWEDLDHRYVTGVHVLRRLVREQPDRVNGAAPVVLTNTIGFENVRTASDSLSSNSELKFAISQTSQVWLDQMVTVDDGRLIVNWDVVDELFPADMVDDMFAAYMDHLKRLARDDAAWLEPRVARARRLLPARQQRQRKQVNATEQPVRDTWLHMLFEEQAAARPDQLAIVSGNLRLTYAETCRLSRQLGATLRELGAQPNELVAIVMEKGWEQVVAALAILQSGAAYVPIDANLPDERRVQLIGNAGAKVVLTQRGMVGKLAWPAGVRVLTVEPPEKNSRDVAPLPPVQRTEDLAYVIYTSGSTGLPKGVMIDHRGAVNTILDMNHRFAVLPEDRVLALSSLSFDLSVYDIFGMLAAGGTIVIPEATATRDPERWTELVEREGVTIWNSVPALMEMFVEYRAGRSAGLPPSLRLVLMSGDWIPVTLPAQIRALSSSVQLMSLGGATEASIWSIVYPIDHVDPDWKSIPYGRPMVNQTFHVLDDSFEPRPVWVPGQLFIGGIGVAKGYWHDEEKTKAKFVTHPRTGERLYATGDLGRYLPSGDIEFLGREDFQVKIRGFRIELGEIEAAFRQHPSVKSVVVAAVGKTTAERRLLAYVIPQPAGDGDGDARAPGETDAMAMTRIGLEATLLEFLATKLPEHMCPARVVLLDQLPLTPNGKVDLRSLPVPETMSASGETALAAPRNDAEAALVDVWREVLHTEAVGIQDNFFDLGGDSVSAIQVVSRVIRRGYELSPVMLFRYPTVAELAMKLAPVKAARNDSDEITL